MFKKEIRGEIEIMASPQKVWKALTDFEAFTDWNPFIRPVVGEAKGGSRLRVQIKPPGGRSVAFRPVVAQVIPDRELRWKGRLWLPALFDGEHIFEIEPLGAERVRFVQRRCFLGFWFPSWRRASIRPFPVLRR